jgi:diaminopimelate decarboxylase
LHTSIEGFEVADDCLCIDGRKLIDIVQDAAQTPVYIYARSLIDARIQRLRRHIPAAVKIHYAMKANPHPDIVQFIAPLVDGIDVASEGELRVALTTDTAHANISFAGPGKRPSEIQFAVRSGIVLNVESPTELARIVASARELGTRAPVAIRVNPAFELKGSGMRMSGGPKPFGIDAECVPEMLRTFDTSNLEFVGFHIFTGSQNLNASAICEAQSRSVELAIELSRHAPTTPKIVNVGGGFGIPYFPGDKPLDIAPIGSHLGELVGVLQQRLPGADLVVELGRYIVGEAGIFVCRVIDRKVSRGQTYLITDGGFHHHLAATGNFGQVIRRNYPVLVGNRVAVGEVESVCVVGPLCTPLDILADKMAMPHAEIGDLIVVFQSGAYGFSASPRSFLSHPEPLELVI